MARFCTECGSELPDGMLFCTQCGTKAEQDTPAPRQNPIPRTVPQRAATPAPQYVPVSQPQAEPAAEKAVGTGTFFGLIFLFSLPVLGWLICLIMAFTAKNKNIKHFARAMLIWLVIALVIGALVGLAVNALINSVTPYLEQAMGELSAIGDSADLGELAELIDQFGSLEGLIPESIPVE